MHTMPITLLVLIQPNTAVFTDVGCYTIRARGYTTLHFLFKLHTCFLRFSLSGLRVDMLLSFPISFFFEEEFLTALCWQLQCQASTKYATNIHIHISSNPSGIPQKLCITSSNSPYYKMEISSDTLSGKQNEKSR